MDKRHSGATVRALPLSLGRFWAPFPVLGSVWAVQMGLTPGGIERGIRSKRKALMEGRLRVTINTDIDSVETTV